MQPDYGSARADVFAVEDVALLTETVLPMGHRLLQGHPVVQVKAFDAAGLIQRQLAGTVCCTLRRGGHLIGVCFARRVGHGAADAGMFIEPEHRGGWSAIRFAEFVEQEMQARGAAWMLWECEPASEVLARRRGLAKLSTRYVKALQEPV
jgi:GNAT superfamily N-acetyltransferase